MTVKEEIIQNIFKLPILSYPFNALEPYIDQQTMELHYGKHHKSYVRNFQDELLNSGKEFDYESLVDILKNISQFSEKVRNNAGGHYNHTLFWSILTPTSPLKPSGKLAEAINEQFDSFESFKNTFEETAINIFGSGWAWLVVDDGLLKVGATANQDNPLMDVTEFKGIPVMGVDVWEHAYYLKYQNNRKEYLSSIWNIIDWHAVSKRYIDATA